MRVLVLTTCLLFGVNSDAALGAPSLNGIWQSDGYGFVLEIHGETARLFSNGAGMCVPETDTMVPITDLLPGAEFEASDNGQLLNIGFEMEPHRIRAHRRQSLPLACATHQPADAINVFNTFVGYFEASYPFFLLYDVDWPSRVAEARTRVRFTMSDQALFEELSWLIAPIQDGHVALVAEIDGKRKIAFPGRARVLQDLRDVAQAAGEDPESATREFRHALWHQSIPQNILNNRGQMVGNDRIQYGMLNGELGYLAFLAMDGFGSDALTPMQNLTETQSLLDNIMTYFVSHGTQSIVLDLSLNFGGSDYIAREIASRFLNQPVLAYSKFAGDADKPIVTPVSIEPSSGVSFGGNVTLLTSQATVSAAEVLTLSLRSQSHVTHIGEATRGALSDGFSRSLPNGWQLSLSNEVYLDSEGHHWEAAGIPSELRRPVFQADNPVESHLRAIRWITEERK